MKGSLLRLAAFSFLDHLVNPTTLLADRLVASTYHNNAEHNKTTQQQSRADD
jgi:hypothetical protein